jgi:DNA-binding transcriptional regulator YiaG
MERHNLTRSQLACYLGVSPQLVSVWYVRHSKPSAIVEHTVFLLELIERAMPEVHASLLANLRPWSNPGDPDWLDRADAIDRLVRRYRLNDAALGIYLNVPLQTASQWVKRTRKSPIILNRTLYLLGLIEAFMPAFHKGVVHKAKYGKSIQQELARRRKRNRLTD